MSGGRPLWLRDPLAVLAEGDAGGGIVVAGTRIVELVPAGGRPATPDPAVLDAGRHVVLPGLINGHHHFFQTLTRACPPALNRPLFPWLQALHPIWARLAPEQLRLAVRTVLAELLLSGTTTASDHHYLFPASLHDAIDIEVEEARALGMQADLALFTLDELSFSGVGDPLAALVLCGGSQADRVMAAGRWRGENGRIPGLDLARLQAEHGAAARRLLES